MVKGLDYFVRKASLVTFSCKDCSVTCCDVEYRRRRSYSYVSGCIAGVDQPIQISFMHIRIIFLGGSFSDFGDSPLNFTIYYARNECNFIFLFQCLSIISLSYLQTLLKILTSCLHLLLLSTPRQQILLPWSDNITVFTILLLYNSHF